MNLKAKAKQVISNRNLAGSFTFFSLFLAWWNVYVSAVLLGIGIAYWYVKEQVK